MEVIISFIDYIEENGSVVRGSDTVPITMHYELIFTASSNGIVQITQDLTNWVMSKKIAKGQR